MRRTSKAKYYQLIDWKESHCIINVAGSTTLGIPGSTVKIFCADTKKIGVWSIVLHWNENVFILMKSSSLAAPKVVKMTTFGAASDETFIKMMTFSFQCISGFPQSHPKGKTELSFLWQHETERNLTEPTLNVDSVAPHQLKNGTAPIMTWWLPGLSFNVDTVWECSITRCEAKLIMMTSSNGNIFRVTGHLCGKFTGPRWISRTMASDAELWCFLWFTPE